VKLIFVGVFTHRSTNVSQAEAFERQGVELTKYSYRKREQDLGVRGRDIELLGICHSTKPDGVIFSKCDSIGPPVFTACRDECGAVSVMWYMDPMRWFNRMPERIARCDITFCNIRAVCAEAQKHCSCVEYLQEGFDPAIDKPADVPYIHDVTFIGNVHGRNDRQALTTAVNATLIDSAYREDHARVVSESKINLNFTEGGASDRVYKVMAAGGFLLTQPWPLMEKDFVVGQDLDVFNNEQELKDKIVYWLQHPEERDAVAKRGRQTVAKFSRDAWALHIINAVANRSCHV
jgi:hypothetical protein